MGSNIIITVFAVVVIGGMGSILGAIVSGFALGLVEGRPRSLAEASSTAIFVIMALVLLVSRPVLRASAFEMAKVAGGTAFLTVILVASALVAPLVLYPVFLMEGFASRSLPVPSTC